MLRPEMINCRLTMFGEGGRRAPDVPVTLSPLPTQPDLDRVYRNHIGGGQCRYAVIRRGKTVHAMYLAPDLLPGKAVMLPTGQRYVGRWSTVALSLGSNRAMRAIMGPSLFFRQLDLAAAESWMAPVLMRFQHSVTCRVRTFGTAVVHEWEIYGLRYFVARHRSTWRLYGGGNTPGKRLEKLCSRMGDVPARTFLWEIGAIPLTTERR